MDNPRSTRAAIVLSAIATLCPAAFGLNPSLDVNQYAHTAWPIREGFFKGIINSIGQTPDGYLWLGSEFGLLRFDGVRVVSWKPPGADRLPSGAVTRLLVAHDGTLWIATYLGLASWNGAKLIHYRELDQHPVVSLFEDRDGTIWAGSGGTSSGDGRLCAIRNETAECYGQNGSLGQGVHSLLQDRSGDLWVGASTGLWRWRPNQPKLYPVPHSTPTLEIRDVNTTPDGQLLLATNVGILQFAHGQFAPYLVPGAFKVSGAGRLLRDRDGGLWIGTSDRGILHVHQNRTDVFSRVGGLSDDFVTFLFQDREGNVWAATNGGLDRFREFAVPPISLDQGLSTDSTWSIEATRDGSVWVGSRDGLNRWNNGRITTIRKTNGLPDFAPQSLFADVGRIWMFSNRELGYVEDGAFLPVRALPGERAHAIVGDGAGGLWLSGDRALLRVNAGRVVEQIPWSELGAEGPASALLPGVEPGGLWLGFMVRRGVIYLKNGHVQQSYSAADGLGEGAIGGLKVDHDGTLWAATAGGLSVIKSGHVNTLTTKNGLPCDTVHWAMDDDNGSTWLYLACGLVRLDRTAFDAWRADPQRVVHSTVFDISDGVMFNSTSPSWFSPRVTKSQDGRLWFLTGAGVSVVDPRSLPYNKLPPPVHVEEIIADDKTRWTNASGTVASNLRLSALTRRLEIKYTALSLVAPDKVHFKYKLEGYDTDWEDAGNGRNAVYTSLSPRRYRFRVIASNNSGVWNEAGDSLDFSVAPAYYQTIWFQSACGIVFLALLWGFYRYRLYQVAREFNVRLEERVSERTRLARDLHDTLLQSFHGLMLHFQAVNKLLPEGKAKKQQEIALELAHQVFTESRSTVYDLRSSATTTNELSEALNAVGNELSKEDTAEFGLVVEGPPRVLHPIVRDELYRISREALRNAFKHARARHIEAEINYGDRVFRMRIRDDGEGIPAAILEQGRPGHYGLRGMRERARQVGADLNIWSRAGSGTEVDLNVAGSIAYGTSPRLSRLRIFGKKGRET